MKDKNFAISSVRFEDPVIERATWQAVVRVYGKDWQETKAYRHEVSLFIKVVCSFTVSSLSLGSLKERLVLVPSHCRLHSVAFWLLANLRDSYQADDAAAFRELLPLWLRRQKAHSIMFDDAVKSFWDLAFCQYYEHGFFCVIRASEPFLVPIFRRYVNENEWKCSDKPTQKSFDQFFVFVEQRVVHRGITTVQGFDQSLLFDLIDSAVDYREAREDLIRETVRFFRFGINRLGFCLTNSAGPLTTSKVLMNPKTVTFFLCEYVDRQHTVEFHSRHASQQYFLVTLNLENEYLNYMYGSLLTSGTVSRDEYNACSKTLESSLGEFVGIDGRLDNTFSEGSLLAQMDFYRELYSDSKRRTEAIAFVKAFYIMIDAVMNGAFFRSAKTITYGLLTTRRFVSYFDEGYVFREYNPYDSVTSGDRIVFILHGFNRQSRSLLKEDYVSIDYSCVKNPFYKSLAWRITTSTRVRLIRRTLPCTLRLLLNKLLFFKSSAGYPTPALDVFSVWDAIFIADFLTGLSENEHTYNSYILNIRDFLRWAKASNSMKVDDACFLVLRNKRRTSLPTNRPILSDDEIATLTKYFVERGKVDTLYNQVLILFHLCILTPIRIGHACSIVKDELVYNAKLGSYILTSNSKSTGGGIGEIVLGGKADELIRKALRISESVGLSCPQEDLRKQVFLYCQDGAYSVFTSTKFSQLLAEACNACGLPHYTSRNLRATYMTKAYVEASESGHVDDFLLKLFSYHKNSGTTLENYVNHAEALAAVTDYLKRGGDWSKTIYPDEAAALRDVIAEYNELISESEDDEVTARLLSELRDYEKQLEKMTS